MTEQLGYFASGVAGGESGSPNVDGAFITSVQEDFGHGNYTWSSVSLGVPDVNRWIYAVFSFTSNASRTISSFTIGGISATQVAFISRGGTEKRSTIAIYKAKVPSGSTGSISFNLSGITGAGNGQAVGIYRVIGGSFTQLTDTDSSGSNSVSASLAADSSDFIICGTHSYTGSVSATHTYNNGTRNYHRSQSGVRHSAASGHGITNITDTISASGSSNAVTLAACAIREVV